MAALLMKMRVFLLASVLFLSVLAFSQGALGQTEYWGPRFLIHEEVEADYYHNNTLKDAPTRTGRFYSSVPNNDDVLQYVNITFNTGYATYTNLDDASAAYADALASSTAHGWSQMYCDTSGDNSAANYTFDSTPNEVAPPISLTMSFSNDDGGTHLYSAENIDESGASQPSNTISITFTMTNPSASTRTISDITAHIHLNRDVGAGSAEPHFSNPGQSEGTLTRYDGDSDTYYDYLTWTGVTLSPGESDTATIDMTIQRGDHIGATDDSINLDGGTTGPEAADAGMNATSQSAGGELFSELTVSDKFSRGPIRQGVDLSSNGGIWYVRGFMRNMATASPGGGEYELTYNISEWRIYEINPANGEPYNNPNQTGKFNQTSDGTYLTVGDGRMYTTNATRSSNTTLYNSTTSTKPYISVFFDWEVEWNETGSEVNRTYFNSTLDLPTMYVVDLSAVPGASGTISPEVGGETVDFTLNVTNIGHNNTEPHFLQILHTIPANTSTNAWRDGGGLAGASWEIHSQPLVYINGTYQITPDSENCTMTYSNTSGGADGIVNFTIYDLPSCDLTAGGTVGHTFDENDFIYITYTVYSDAAMTTGDIYNFNGTAQINSSSDTRNEEEISNVQVTVSGKRITGWKELIGTDVNVPTLINSTIQLEVQDNSGSGITGIKFMDFVPESAITYNQYASDNVTVTFYNGSWWTWVKGFDYDIYNNGSVTLPDGLSVSRFEFVNASYGTANTTWNLTDGDIIRVNYELNYTIPGAYVLPVMIAAFDPDTGTSLETTFYGVVKVVIPEPNVPLIINQGTLSQGTTVLVNKPVSWKKSFDVFNPNPRTVSSRFETDVFDDASDGFVSYYDEHNNRVEENIGFAKNSVGSKIMYWDSVMNPNENRNYEVTVLTPPVIEIDRDVEVMETLPNKKVRLKMDIFLKSFAKEDYRNVILNLPISYQNVEEVRDGFGSRLQFTGGLDSTTITVDSMEKEELKTITIIYQESYPTIIITPDRDRYNLNSPVSLEILVINGGEKIEYPFLEVEIYTPGMDVIFSDVEKLESLEPLEKSEMFEKFVIPATAPAGSYVATAKFREDFAVLASTTGNFYVVGVEGGIPGTVEIVMILLVGGILAFFSYKRLREVRGTKRFYGGRF